MSIISPVAQACKTALEPFADHLILKTILAYLGIATGFLFGVEFYNYIWVIVVLVVLDSFTGVWGAKISGEVISSKRFILSVPKLLRYLIFIVAGHLLQSVIPFEMYIENVVVIFLATTEFISIAENLGKAGMPVPKKLLNKIEELRDRQ
jgi:toxin secretion/phage lysis holin